MNVWLLKIGEPIPIDGNCKERLHRMGLLSQFIARAKHKVTWWTSTFDRVTRKNIFNSDMEIYPFENVRVKMLHSPGYRKSISMSRLRDQILVANKFRQCALDEPQPDIILCAYPTIELCRASVEYGKQFKVPVVLDLRDMWPDILVDSQPKVARPFLRYFLRKMFDDSKFACAEATALTGITDAFVDWGLEKGKRIKSVLDRSFPMGYISTPPCDEDLRKAERYWDALGITKTSDYITVCFLGTFGHQFDIETSISSARMLKASGYAIRFIFCGEGDRLKYFRKMAIDCENIIFPGWIDAAKMYVLLRRSSIGLNPIIDRYDFLSTINNKAIEYMSAGLPILSSPKKGILFNLLRSERCGTSFESNNAGELAEILMQLADNPDLLSKMSQNAARLFTLEFSAERIYTEMTEYLDDVVTHYKHSIGLLGQGLT